MGDTHRLRRHLESLKQRVVCIPQPWESGIAVGVGLAIGESSLGTVFIDHYGWELDYDAAVVWTGTQAPGPCPPDSDGDGFVRTTPSLAIIGNWGACPPPTGSP